MKRKTEEKIGGSVMALAFVLMAYGFYLGNIVLAMTGAIIVGFTAFRVDKRY